LILPGPWEQLCARLERIGSRLEACAPDDLPRLAELLAERQAAVEELLPAAAGDAQQASPEVLDRLSAASRAGDELAIRLRLQTEALRKHLAAETARARLLVALSSPQPQSHRFDLRS
jgi:hypothetical protein